ncbi:hypothetical protein [Maribacter sp. 2304DJ31-5]|uniref:hypothetical protein n=1 Tax=Maribacter sp. 2304DJ31-5 TaxID=3386273 RepID=UPI0039BC7084
MTTRLGFFALVFLLLSPKFLCSQDSLSTTVAQQGDGIFSILRKSGIDPIKYYGEFLKLNPENIRNASELIVGKTYILPDAPDSFKKMGIRINIDTGKEHPIFDRELNKMVLKDSTLQNTVYYLIHFKNPTVETPKKEGDRNLVKMARELLLKGARAYILEDGLETIPLEAQKKYRLGEFATIINKKYLTHNGAYQRVLVIQDQNMNNKNYTLSVRHYEQSKEGEKLAANLREILTKNTLGKRSAKNNGVPFKDEASIFFARNILPPVTTIAINDISEITKSDIRMKTSKERLPLMITKGILLDYSKLDFEDR